MRSIFVLLLALTVAGRSIADETPPLLDYGKMQALKLRLVDHLWEVEVLPKPEHPAMDPETVPRRYGQGVAIEVPQRGIWILVSGDLVRDWSHVEARATRGRTCALEELRALEDLDVALIRCRETLEETPPVPLAPDEIGVEGALVFSVDNPTGNMPSIFYGFLAEPAEPPLSAFHYTNIGGFWSAPLLNHRGELVALTLRRLRPQPDTLSIAVTCRQLRSRLTIRRRDPEGPTRIRTSTRRPFHFE
ncbi:MAG: serine protease [Pseudomonadota bacterium]